MPDFSRRDHWEAVVARILSKEFRGQKDKLRELLAAFVRDFGGQSGLAPHIAEEYYTDYEKAVRKVLEPLLMQVAMESGEQLDDALTFITADWGLVNEAAVEWAHGYSFNLVRGITNTTRRGLGRAVVSYFEDGLTMGELEQLITQVSPLYGGRRAEMIAVTEVTRAAARGEMLVVDEIQRQGIRMRSIWQTNNDELVCPICGPLHNKPADGLFPPAHVRCRCWLNHEVVTDDNN